MLQLLGGRWERNPAAEQRICGRSHAQYALSLLLHIFCLYNQIVDLLISEDLPQEAEIFQFGAQGIIFSFEPVVGCGQMLILSVEPTVGGVQPVIAVQSLVIAAKHLTDDFFQPLDQGVSKPLFIGLGRH